MFQTEFIVVLFLSFIFQSKYETQFIYNLKWTVAQENQLGQSKWIFCDKKSVLKSLETNFPFQYLVRPGHYCSPSPSLPPNIWVSKGYPISPIRLTISLENSLYRVSKKQGEIHFIAKKILFNISFLYYRFLYSTIPQEES